MGTASTGQATEENCDLCGYVWIKSRYTIAMQSTLQTIVIIVIIVGIVYFNSGGKKKDDKKGDKDDKKK